MSPVNPKDPAPRADTPFADIYQRSQGLSAMAGAAAYWALGIMRIRKQDGEPFCDLVPLLRLTLDTRREQRVVRAALLAESFARSIGNVR